MRRAQDMFVRPIPRTQASERGFFMKPADMVITTMGALAVAFILAEARWVPGWKQSAVTFAIIGAGPWVFRSLAQRYPNVNLFDFIASFWLLPSVVVGHFHLGPIVTAMSPGLMDHLLAHADLRLFGAHPSLVLGQLAGPVVTEVLMVCYYSYFVGPFILALLLWFGRGPRRAWDEYALALALFFTCNFILYALVPAVGPRYYLAGIFNGPLQGLLLTPYLDALMKKTLFAKDCFPSGHTGVTLIMLTFAYRNRRRFFWIMLPVGTGLILGTLVGRFHYGIDLICAVPLVIACVSVAVFVTRVVTEPELVRRRVRAFRELVKI